MKRNQRAYYQAHKEEIKLRSRAWNKAHREEKLEKDKAYNKSHKEELNEYSKAYQTCDVNSSGKTKANIRAKSRNYLNKYGSKIPGYEIHHCCTYDEPYKFIYCPKEIHLLIHSYLREHNIDSDSEHYEQIKHLLDDTVVLYGII